MTVDTSADERRLLRIASRLRRRTDGLVYLDGSIPARAPSGVADSLLAKELLVETVEGFSRTLAGDQVIATRDAQPVEAGEPGRGAATSGNNTTPKGDSRMSVSTEPELEQHDIHGWFGLSYSNFLVLPRALMQSMPEEWQYRFTALVDELRAAFAHLEHPEYHVEAGRWVYLDDLTDAQFKALGISRSDDQVPDDDEESDRTVAYYDRNGQEIDQHSASVFLPGMDPIPRYNRGRTRVQRADEIAGGKPTSVPA
jgi:hypothetical protein